MYTIRLIKQRIIMPLALGRARNNNAMPQTHPKSIVMRSHWIKLAVLTVLIDLTARPASAALIVQDVVALSGTVNPITYTDSQGTFTTSVINLSFDPSTPSFMTLDLTTGGLTAHTVMDVSFNNGKLGPDNQNLFGIFTVDENGVIGSIDPNGLIQPQPVLLDITNAVLTGAGEFAGTTAAGKNPVYNPDLMQYQWRILKVGTPPTSPVTLDLPPGFIGGANVAINSTINATTVVIPEPSTLALLLGGLACLFSFFVFRRRQSGDIAAEVFDSGDAATRALTGLRAEPAPIGVERGPNSY